MKDTIKIKEFAIDMLRRYREHNISAASAQVAYYWLMAFFPFLIFIITLLSYTKVSVDILLMYLSQAVPATVFESIKRTIRQFVVSRSTTLLSAGGIIAIWSASRAVAAMTRGIHVAYNSEYMRPYWKERIYGLGYALLFALLIILVMVGLVFGNTLGGYMIKWLSLEQGVFMPIWNLVRLSMPVIALITVLYIIYKGVPIRYTKSAIVWPGVLFTTIGWYGFSLAFSVYIDNYSKYNQLYGSIGSVFVLLIWLYVLCIVLLLGAEINACIKYIKEYSI